MEKIVAHIQGQLNRLGFPDMQEEIVKGIQGGKPVFTIASLRYFRHGPAGKSDFLQYSVEVEPRAADHYPLTKGQAVLFRVHNEKAVETLQMKTVSTRFDTLRRPLPTVTAAYQQLKSKLEQQQQHQAPRKVKPAADRHIRPVHVSRRRRGMR